MISVKKQGRYEVFSRGVEEPWSIWRDGKPHRQVWTWPEVDEVLRDEAPKRAHARKSKVKRLPCGRCKDPIDGDPWDSYGTGLELCKACDETAHEIASTERSETSSKRAHARKSKAQRERELAEERERSQRWLVTFQVPGSPWVYLAATGSGTMDPDAAVDFGSRSAAEARAVAMQGPRSSIRAKVTSRPKT